MNRLVCEGVSKPGGWRDGWMLKGQLNEYVDDRWRGVVGRVYRKS